MTAAVNQNVFLAVTENAIELKDFENQTRVVFQIDPSGLDKMVQEIARLCKKKQATRLNIHVESRGETSFRALKVKHYLANDQDLQRFTPLIVSTSTQTQNSEDPLGHSRHVVDFRHEDLHQLILERSKTIKSIARLKRETLGYGFMLKDGQPLQVPYNDEFYDEQLAALPIGDLQNVTGNQEQKDVKTIDAANS